MDTETSSRIGSRIEAIVVESGIEAYLVGCLDHVQSVDDLVRLIRRFTLYNQPFPAGVAHLAALLHVRSDRFVDESDAIVDNADRSSLIASNVIFAAEDEFAGPDRMRRTTHRQMAQAMLRAAADFAGWSTHRVNNEFASDHTHDAMADRLRRGYRMGQDPTDAELFRALGFHLGSERLADIEFRSLDCMLRDRFPLFVAKNLEAVGESDAPIYTWITTHTAVEADHYDYSLTGAGQAVDYYAGPELKRSQIEDLIIEGFQEFVSFQASMFDWLRLEGSLR